ncbi:MAG: aminotransferase class IV [Gemmatimonadetes bacterium]|nr:aminotransferase class IV [Gemmatimonadota bacterium]
MIVYLNGGFVDHAEARVSVDDRGFLFADGLYEVIRAYDGRLFLPGPHLDRLRRGLEAIRLESRAPDSLIDVSNRLLVENGLIADDAIVYIQITRGAAPRRHSFPAAGTAPTVYVAVRPYPRPGADAYENGESAISVPDNRWGRCDIKSIGLLPNVLANQRAKEAGAFEALFVRDGVLIEGSHSNLAAVIGGEVVTYPECNYILGGITRDCVLDLARRSGIAVREGPIFIDRFDDIEELFLTGTTTEVMPLTRLDGRPVGDGRVGPIARRLQHAYIESVRSAPPEAERATAGAMD